MLWRALKSPCFHSPRPLSTLETCASRIRTCGPVNALRTSRYFHDQPQHARAEDVSRRASSFLRHSTLLDSQEKYGAEQNNESIKITGLVRSVRKQKKIAFARVADGSTLASIQAVFPNPALAKDITNGAYVSLIGKWVPSTGVGQSHELQVEQIETLGESNPLENPIQKQSMGADFLRSIPHLRMRTSFQSLLVRTRSHLTAAIATHFHTAAETPVYQVHPPLITSSDCEGAGEVFTITPQSQKQAPGTSEDKSKEEARLYFREPKYLTVSSQLHLEAYSAELGDVFTLSPTFRAEESDTPRHLAEFYMLEAEHRDISLDELLSKVKALVFHLTQAVRDHRTGRELLEYYSDHKHRASDDKPVDLEDRWSRLLGPWHTVDYSSAIIALEEAHRSSGGKLFATRPRWEHGLQLEHERWIVDNLAEGKPVFVTHYPKAIKPFYMLASSFETASSPEQGSALQPDHASENRDTVACFDLLLPHGYCETVGGSLREHRLENLIQNMRQSGLLKEEQNNGNGDGYPFLHPGESLGSLKWYADLRRFGSSPHGGYGLGFDRLLAYLTGVSNVRDVVGFPRTWGRADC